MFTLQTIKVQFGYSPDLRIRSSWVHFTLERFRDRSCTTSHFWNWLFNFSQTQKVKDLSLICLFNSKLIIYYYINTLKLSSIFPLHRIEYILRVSEVKNEVHRSQAVNQLTISRVCSISASLIERITTISTFSLVSGSCTSLNCGDDGCAIDNWFDYIILMLWWSYIYIYSEKISFFRWYFKIICLYNILKTTVNIVNSCVLVWIRIDLKWLYKN